MLHRTPARMLRWHRARREHRRRRRETIALYRAVLAAVEHGYQRVIGYTDARFEALGRRKRG